MEGSASERSASSEDRRATGRRPIRLAQGPGAYCIGRFRFEDASLADLAARSGNEAAWVAAFERHGESALARVRGSFAVAVRDRAGTLTLAVDRFSIESLCFRIDDGDVAFHPRADALATLENGFDPQALFDYLYFHVIPAPRTFHRGVVRVPAGHFAQVRGRELAVRRWWTPTFVDAPSSATFADLRAEFRSLLRDSVVRSLDGRDAGCFLSGGTDSSTVAGLVGEATGRPARTFSIGFDAKGYDEMAYARIAARRFGTEHREYYVTADDIVDAVPRIAAHYDQPFGNSSVVPAFHCARIARESGVGLMLAGDGGDELFGGNSRYAKQRVFEAYRHLPRWLRESIVEPAATGWPLLSRLPALRKAVSYVRQARVPMPDRLQLQNLVEHIGCGEILTPGILEAIDVSLPLRHQREVYAATASGALVNSMLAFDWRLTLADNDLPKVIGATSLAGVDVHFPLLDEAVVDFSLRLAPELKLRGLRLRWFFKEALRGFLPDEILRKKKHGFGLPFGVWLTEHRRLRELAYDSLRSLARRGIVRGAFVDRLIDEHVDEHPAYYGELVWILMMLEQWLAARTPAPAPRA